MRVLTIRSVEEMADDLKLEVHYAFGMEQHTDYVFKDKEGANYSSTINVGSTDSIISAITKNSTRFPDVHFIVDDLDLESNVLVRYMIKDGRAKEEHP